MVRLPAAGRTVFEFWTETNLMSALFRKASLLWAYARDGENMHVLVDGRLVSMTRSQARRYRELRSEKSSLCWLVNKTMSNDRI